MFVIRSYLDLLLIGGQLHSLISYCCICYKGSRVDDEDLEMIVVRDANEGEEVMLIATLLAILFSFRLVTSIS